MSSDQRRLAEEYACLVVGIMIAFSVNLGMGQLARASIDALAVTELSGSKL